MPYFESRLDNGIVQITDSFGSVRMVDYEPGPTDLRLIAEGRDRLYYFNDDRNLPANSNFGLQVFNAQGQPIFWSGNKYARVVQLIEYHNDSNWNQLVIPIPYGRTYAVAFLVRPWIEQVENRRDLENGGAGWNVRYRMLTGNVIEGDPSGTYLRIGYRTGNWTNWSLPYPTQQPGRAGFNHCVAVVLDVTGY